MDFVVVGLGLGALGILFGVVMVAVLAPRHDRAAARTSAADEAARDRAIAAEQRETGVAALAAGTAILVVTTIALATALDDRTAAFLVAATATLAVAGILYWVSLYRRRHPRPRLRRARTDTLPTAIAAPVRSSTARENGSLPDLALFDIDPAQPAPHDEALDTATPDVAAEKTGSPPTLVAPESEPARDEESHPAGNNGSSHAALPANPAHLQDDDERDTLARPAVAASPGSSALSDTPGSEWDLPEDAPAHHRR